MSTLVLRWPFRWTLRLVVVGVWAVVLGLSFLLYSRDRLSAVTIATWLAYTMFLPWFVGSCSGPHTCTVSLSGAAVKESVVGSLDAWYRALWISVTIWVPCALHLLVFSFGPARPGYKPIRRSYVTRRSLVADAAWALVEYVVPVILFIRQQIPILTTLYRNYGVWSIVVSPGMAWIPLGACLLLARQQLFKFQSLCADADASTRMA